MSEKVKLDTSLKTLFHVIEDKETENDNYLYENEEKMLLNRLPLIHSLWKIFTVSQQYFCTQINFVLVSYEWIISGSWIQIYFLHHVAVFSTFKINYWNKKENQVKTNQIPPFNCTQNEKQTTKPNKNQTNNTVNNNNDLVLSCQKQQEQQCHMINNNNPVLKA